MRIILITFLIFSLLPGALCNASDDDLCALISQIREMPFKNEPVEDNAYNRIIAAGYDALPCLIANVANTTPMLDPRKAPKFPNTTIGDIAFFIFLDTTKESLDKFLPDNVAKKLKERGVYAYFEHSEKIENRIELQTSLIRWLVKNKI